MKRLFWLFNLFILLFSVFTPAFTYATEAEDEAIKILNDKLEDVMCWFKSSNLTFSLQQWENNHLTLWLNDNKVIFNPNWWAFSWMWVNEIIEYEYKTDDNWIMPIYNTKIPNRKSEDMNQQSWWMFAWWYTKSWDNNDWWEEFDLSNPNSKIVYAKWLPFNDLNVKIWDYTFTVMDRNLWALETAEWEYYWNWNYENTNKLWYLYQFWNGYWFKNNPGTNITNYQESKISIPEGIEPLWENDNYYSYNKFIRIASNWYEWSHKNLWWSDNLTSNDDNRKWPCPVWYHIPSQDEWKIIYYTLIKTNECNWDLEQKWKCLAKKFKLPYAWSINVYSPNKWKILSQGSYAYYYNSKGGWINFDNTSVYPEAGWAEAQWWSIRCFKDHQTSKEITFNTNWWIFNDWGNLLSIQFIRKWQRYEAQEYLKIPVKTWWMFAWWYTKSWDWNWENQINEIDFELAGNTTVYAKWLPFRDLDLWILWLDWVKIMDRNLWSEGVATGTFYELNQWHEDYKNLWYYYQRWNSYWFQTNEKILYTDKNNRIDWDLFWPTRNYYNYVYKNIDGNPSSYVLNNRLNLWWWEETLNRDIDKQWPCPIWYHIPDKDEFNAIINKFNTLKGNEWFCNNVNEKECFAEKLKLPFAWYRTLNYSPYGSEWNYWTSSPSWTYSYRLWFNKYNLNVSTATDFNLYSIRCFKNNDKLIKFETNWWNNLEWKYYILRRRENKENKIILPWLGLMEKDWYTFEWRYSTSWFEEWTNVVNNDITTNNDEITLYAKWKKNPTLTLKANWWKFESWDEEKVIKANKIFEKRLINDEFSNKTVRKVVVFTWAESLNIRWSWLPKCNYEINIYNCDKEKNIECNIYKTISSNCWSNWCFLTSEDIPWDTITIEAETWTCNATPKFNFTVSSNWTRYYEIEDDVPNIQRNWYEFLWWYDEGYQSLYDFKSALIKEDKTLYAQWKPLEEKAQETTAGNITYTNETKVTIWTEVQDETINNSSMINLVSKEVEQHEVKEENDKTTVQESEIQVTSDKKVEYKWWLEVYLEKTTNIGEEKTKERIEWTAKFSSPVAVKIPITSNAETVKVQVKHEWEDFWYTWLTLNPYNECTNWEAVNDKYNWESVWVIEINWEKYALIYTCSASTFVAYTENAKPVVVNESTPTPAAWWGRTISTTTNEQSTNEPEHSSADDKNKSVEQNTTTQAKEITIDSKLQQRSLTRWEVAVMTNILLDIFPELINWKQGIEDITNACTNYTDEQKFTKDEKKAITRLCKLSIMWIHADNNKPLDEFMVNERTKNNEFSKVINRSISTYTEKDLSVVKEALKKLEDNEENVEFWTVYNVFMSIKSLFN